MRAFITGITGMAGSYLAEHLLASGDQVLGCSRRGSWPPYLPAELPGCVELFPWDAAAGLTDGLRQQVDRFAPQWVFHLAALSVPADCGWPEPTPLAQAVNVGGTEAVCRLAGELRSRPRVVLASSCHVYGEVEAGSPVVAEDAPLRPRGGYGKTKLAAEEAIRRGAREMGIDAVVARPFHHTGPRQLPRLMVPQWARQLAAEGSGLLRILTRDAWLDLCDVRDVVRAYRSLASDGVTGETYNIGSGRNLRSGDVLDVLLGICGAQREVLETAPGRRQNPVADASRLHRETGWQPEIPLETTLRDTLEFWRSRPFAAQS